MGVKVRIIQQPSGTVDGISLDDFQVGHSYELTPPIADYLVLSGFAIVDLRGHNRSRRLRFNDRRRR